MRGDDVSLDDDQLVVLLDGGDPTNAGLASSPVAAFLTQARTLGLAEEPSPNAALVELMDQGLPIDSATIVVAPGQGPVVADAPAPTSVLDAEVAPTLAVQPSELEWSSGVNLQADVQPEVQLFEPTQQVGLSRQQSWPTGEHAAAAGRRRTKSRRRSRSGNRSPRTVVTDLFRPSASKALVVVTLGAAALLAGPALGLYDVPGLPGSAETTGLPDGVVDGTVVADTESTSTTATTIEVTTTSTTLPTTTSTTVATTASTRATPAPTQAPTTATTTETTAAPTSETTDTTATSSTESTDTTASTTTSSSSSSSSSSSTSSSSSSTTSSSTTTSSTDASSSSAAPSGDDPGAGQP